MEGLVESTLSLSEIQSLLSEGSLTLEQLVQQYLDRIESSSELNIYVEVFKSEALDRAKELDKAVTEEDYTPGKLHGAVISIKDVLCYRGHEVTAGSKILEGFKSQFTGTAIQRMLDEGAIIIGRTNCDEFAMGSTNEHSVYGATSNGLDNKRVPGGSSGAAAVSVEQGTCLIGIGSDTGGSVRQPAAFCGVYGMKPTYGRISRYGLIAYGSSFDQIGVVAQHVSDCAIAIHVMSGHDPMDATSASIQPPKAGPFQDQKQYRIAYIPEVLEHESLNEVIREDCQQLIGDLRCKGHECEPITFDLLPYLVPTYYVLTTAEASSNLSRYDGIKYGYSAIEVQDIEELYTKTRSEGFGMEVKRRIMMGTFVLSVGYFDAYFTKAQQVRTLIIQRLEEIFASYDFILLPTTTDIAWEKGQIVNDPLAMYLSDIYTVLANLGGYPAISIPRHSDRLSMPFGLQFMGKRYQEEALFTLCQSL